MRVMVVGHNNKHLWDTSNKCECCKAGTIYSHFTDK